MPAPLSPKTIDEALQDLHCRTLAKLNGDLAKLVYLASTRNYNSGRYEHDGLSMRFAPSVAEEALATAHREVFANLALAPLEVLVEQLVQYVSSACAQPVEVLTTWKDLEAYRVLPPAGEDPLTVDLFMSNIKIALAIVEPAWKKNHSSPRNALPRPSPDQ
jgi:hypothetical protein